MLKPFGGQPVRFVAGRSHYPSPALVMDGFLSPKENRRLLSHTLTRMAEFEPARTTTRALNYRFAHVLHRFPQFQSLIRARIAAVLPELLRYFGIRRFRPGGIEAQLTVHGHGDFYKVHTDSSSARTRARVISYAYYFCRQPRAFRGGELRIYHAVVRGGVWQQGTRSYHVTPLNNRIVFFLSRYHHEVRPVVCPSKRLSDGRFTINGWIRTS
ncbi:MAG TPA: 2OG-Fe(II) oxygenase [Rubrivivax sp.]|nr:2OG-Fe(II) oxygenase [Rubrivivax sp.]